jgi:hypothetical protein
MAPLEDVSEIRAKRHSDLSFDSDLKRLSALQGRYRENLPLTKHSVRRERVRTSQSARSKVGKKSRVRAKAARSDSSKSAYFNP